MTEHIRVESRDGYAVVVVDDYELFDYVDDHLTEAHDIEQDYYTESEENGRRVFTMHFAATVSAIDLSESIAALLPAEIERTWFLNNSGEGPD